MLAGPGAGVEACSSGVEWEACGAGSGVELQRTGRRLYRQGVSTSYLTRVVGGEMNPLSCRDMSEFLRGAGVKVELLPVPVLVLLAGDDIFGGLIVAQETINLGCVHCSVL